MTESGPNRFQRSMQIVISVARKSSVFHSLSTCNATTLLTEDAEDAELGSGVPPVGHDGRDETAKDFNVGLLSFVGLAAEFAYMTVFIRQFLAFLSGNCVDPNSHESLNPILRIVGHVGFKRILKVLDHVC
ncbi:unnamed protein product [Calypogeia fissa]